MRQECHLDARGCVGSTSRHFLLYDWATIALRFLVIVRAAIAAEILRRGEILRGIGRAVPLELREVQIAGGGHASSPSERRRAAVSFVICCRITPASPSVSHHRSSPPCAAIIVRSALTSCG